LGNCNSKPSKGGKDAKEKAWQAQMKKEPLSHDAQILSDIRKANATKASASLRNRKIIISSICREIRTQTGASERRIPEVELLLAAFYQACLDASSNTSRRVSAIAFLSEKPNRFLAPIGIDETWVDRMFRQAGMYIMGNDEDYKQTRKPNGAAFAATSQR
jgi:hypothetical protein